MHEELAREFIDIVDSEARRMNRRVGRFVDYDELVSVGNLGLAKALQNYREEDHETFGAYARMRIRGAMVDELRRNDMAPRRLRRTQRNVRDATDHLEKKLGRSPTVTEVAAYLEVERDEVYDAESAPNVVSLDPTAPVSTAAPDPEEAYLLQRRKERLEAAISELSERTQKIFAWHYEQGVTFTEIGRRLGISQARVSQIHSKAKKDLKKSVSAA